MDQRIDSRLFVTTTASRGDPESPAGDLRPRVRQAINLTPNARVVLEKRYLRRGADGKPVETPEEMYDRVARTIAEPEVRYGGDVSQTRERFYALLTDRKSVV